MNRREFLKGGALGVFGMFLTWAGVVKAEEPEPVHDGSAGMLVSEWVYGPPVPHMLSKEEKREAFETAVISEAKMAMGLMSERELFTSDQAFDAIIESVNKWNELVSDNVSLNYSLSAIAPRHTACDKCAHLAACEADHTTPRLCFGDAFAEGCGACACLEECEASYSRRCSDNVSRDYSPETGGAQADKAEWPQGTTWFWDLVNGDDANDGLSPETALLTREAVVSRINATEPSADNPGAEDYVISFGKPEPDWGVQASESTTSDQAFDASAKHWHTMMEPWVSCDDCPREKYCETDGLRPAQAPGADPFFCKCGWGIKTDEQGRVYKTYDMGVSWDYSADTGGVGDSSREGPGLFRAFCEGDDSFQAVVWWRDCHGGLHQS